MVVSWMNKWNWFKHGVSGYYSFPLLFYHIFFQFLLAVSLLLAVDSYAFVLWHAEVITSAEFHPTHCNTLAYSSSKGSIRLVDLRQSALCDTHSQMWAFILHFLFPMFNIIYLENIRWILPLSVILKVSLYFCTCSCLTVALSSMKPQVQDHFSLRL